MISRETRIMMAAFIFGIVLLVVGFIIIFDIFGVGDLLLPPLKGTR